MNQEQSTGAKHNSERPVWNVWLEPLEYNTMEAELTLKTEHEQVMTDNVEVSSQVQQTQCRNLAAISSE